MTTPPVLRIEALSVGYDRGRIIALRGLDLELADGAVGALIGPNGAGKSSCVAAIAGFMRSGGASILHGSIKIDGHEVSGRRPHQVARLGVALVPERNKVFLELTPADHLRMSAAYRVGPGVQGSPSAEEWALSVFPELRPHLRRSAGLLSGGQRQMLAIATALVRQPRLLIVDEFSQGLAPIVVSSLAGRLKEINADGTTLLLVEQNPRLALSLADELVVLDGGRVVAAGTAQALERSPELSSAYLGGGGAS